MLVGSVVEIRCLPMAFDVYPGCLPFATSIPLTGVVIMLHDVSA